MERDAINELIKWKNARRRKTVLNGIASTGGNHDTHASSQSVTIKLKVVSEADGKSLRIPSYQYILP